AIAGWGWRASDSGAVGRSSRGRGLESWDRLVGTTSATPTLATTLRTGGNLKSRNIGAPGRTRTSTMFPPPDFESGASTNSATGAWGVDNSRGAGRVNAEMPLFAGRQFHGEPLCGREGARMAGAPARKSGR